MNNLKYIVTFFLIVILVSCDGLNNIQTPYRINQKDAITDTESAETVLAGVYSRLRTLDFVQIVGITASLGLVNNVPGMGAFMSNDVAINNDALLSLYTANYAVIQEANLFLKKVEILSETELGGAAAKENLLAQARFC